MLQYHTRRTLYHFVRYTLLKSVQIGSFFWSVLSRIRIEYGKIQTRKNSLSGHLSRSDICYFSLKLRIQCWKHFHSIEGVSVTIGNPAFCLALHLTGVHFQVELQYVGDVNEQKCKCRPIRIWEIGGIRLSEALYV